MNTSPFSVSAPMPLDEGHDLSVFACGVASLDEWLKRRTRANHTGGASRTYVISTQNDRVVGYYCLSSGAIAVVDAPGKLKRNMPDPIPIAVLGRLAIDRGWQGRGVGVALLKDAVLRTATAAQILGIRGILVHAISEEAKAFYEHHGFTSAPANPMTLVLPLTGIGSA